jgi:PHD/YefM family antitoxin component YafN of YafNO toxin-antitoxin module
MAEITLETIYKEIKDLKALIDALVETIDILSDPKELKGIREGLMDIKRGRTRSWDEFEQELRREGKI